MQSPPGTYLVFDRGEGEGHRNVDEFRGLDFCISRNFGASRVEGSGEFRAAQRSQSTP